MISIDRWIVLCLLTSIPAISAASTRPVPPRKVVSLNGWWEVEQGTMDKIPAAFSHKVAVPGLVDLAEPKFAEVGRPSKLRQAFWYRRVFRVDAIPEVALLKIHKACYGAKRSSSTASSANTSAASRRPASTSRSDSREVARRMS